MPFSVSWPYLMTLSLYSCISFFFFKKEMSYMFQISKHVKWSYLVKISVKQARIYYCQRIIIVPRQSPMFASIFRCLNISMEWKGSDGRCFMARMFLFDTFHFKGQSNTWIMDLNEFMLCFPFKSFHLTIAATPTYKVVLTLGRDTPIHVPHYP